MKKAFLFFALFGFVFCCCTGEFLPLTDDEMMSDLAQYIQENEASFPEDGYEGNWDSAYGDEFSFDAEDSDVDEDNLEDIDNATKQEQKQEKKGDASHCHWKKLTVKKGEHRNDLAPEYYYRFVRGSTWQRRVIFGKSVVDAAIPSDNTTTQARPQWNKLMYVTYKASKDSMDESCMVAWRKSSGDAEPSNTIALTAFSWYRKGENPQDSKYSDRSMPFIGFVKPNVEYNVKIEKRAGWCQFTVKETSSCHLVNQVRTPQFCDKKCEKSETYLNGFASAWYYGGDIAAPADVTIAISGTEASDACVPCDNQVDPDTLH